jgi:hypothetical protein
VYSPTRPLGFHAQSRPALADCKSAIERIGKAIDEEAAKGQGEDGSLVVGYIQGSWLSVRKGARQALAPVVSGRAQRQPNERPRPWRARAELTMLLGVGAPRAPTSPSCRCCYLANPGRIQAIGRVYSVFSSRGNAPYNTLARRDT